MTSFEELVLGSKRISKNIQFHSFIKVIYVIECLLKDLNNNRNIVMHLGSGACQLSSKHYFFPSTSEACFWEVHTHLRIFF